MRERLPERIYYTLAEIGNLWDVSHTEIRQLLVHGELMAHVWLPMMSVYEITEEADGTRIVMTRTLRRWEGYTPVFAHHCRGLFKRGEILMREFAKKDGSGRYRLPDSAEDFALHLADLVILREELARFERLHEMHKSRERPGDDPGGYDPTFRSVRLDGVEYGFGDIQAAILRILHEAEDSDSPWCNGKQMLRQAGSESYTLSNVFKRHPVWKRLIVSDGRGRYRASQELLTSAGGGKASPRRMVGAVRENIPLRPVG